MRGLNNKMIGLGLVAYKLMQRGVNNPMAGVNVIKSDVAALQSGRIQDVSLTGAIVAGSMLGIGGFSQKKLMQPVSLAALAFGQPLLAAGVQLGGGGNIMGGARRGRRRVSSYRRRRRSRRRR